MNNESGMARFIRGLVKTVFIGCYVAFMWASIHHVATYFDNFEATHDNMFGSYLLAGAFDLTALITTIGVMFFRKSMPRAIQVIVWVFIIGIAVYSYVINWEYANHYQSQLLILQPTGVTTPVYDAAGNLHYVPEMRANTALLFINPLLASGFTMFSLAYSVVAEFFGTKAPSIEELKARKQYLEEIAPVMESIQKLENKNKGKSIIQRAKDIAIETKNAVNELTTAGETEEETTEETAANNSAVAEEIEEKQNKKAGGNRQEKQPQFTAENIPEWLSAGGSTIPLATVAKQTNISIRKLRNRVESKDIRATKNKEIVYKESLVTWMKAEGILAETGNIIRFPAEENETVEEINTDEMEAVSAR